MGLGGATVVTIYKRWDGQDAPKLLDIKPEDDGRQRLGYNPAEEAHSISKADWDSVRAQGLGSSDWATKLLPWNEDAETLKPRARL